MFLQCEINRPLPDLAKCLSTPFVFANPFTFTCALFLRAFSHSLQVDKKLGPHTDKGSHTTFSESLVKNLTSEIGPLVL